MDNPMWTRSTKCHSSTCCVEVYVDRDEVLVRDSKDPQGPALRFTREEWLNFLSGVKAGEFS